MNTNNMGGGEILQYVGQGQGKVQSLLDDGLIRLFGLVPYVKVVIYMLLIVLMGIMLIKTFNIKLPFKGRGVKSELNNIENIKRRDASILRANRFMNWATKVVSKTPFVLDKSYKDYWQYNINRVGLKIPGGTRIMKANEFHSIIQIVAFISICIAVLIMILFNYMLGWVLVIFTIVNANVLPMMIVRQIVKEKDLEIKERFLDFYLMIHYVLKDGTSTPLSSTMKSYSKTTSSKEMHRFIDLCINHIDTYGEYEAAGYISKDYREIPEINKLMRLIRQANEGGDVVTELEGFRTELIEEKRYVTGKRRDKIVDRAKASFNILLIVLFQAVLSAMAIYLQDLGMIKGIIG